MNVLCLGMRKTGTVSMLQALAILGYRVAKFSHFDEQQQANMEAGNFTALAEFDAFISEGRIVPETLLTQFPAAKVIVTIRDMEDWLTSQVAHVLLNRLMPEHRSPKWREANTAKWRKEGQRYESDIAAALAGRSGVLMMNLFNGDGWKELCAFLEVAEPRGREFPRANRMRTNMQRWLRSEVE